MARSPDAIAELGMNVDGHHQTTVAVPPIDDLVRFSPAPRLLELRRRHDLDRRSPPRACPVPGLRPYPVEEYRRLDLEPEDGAAPAGACCSVGRVEDELCSGWLIRDLDQPAVDEIPAESRRSASISSSGRWYSPAS